jgi:hypothetical protein
MTCEACSFDEDQGGSLFRSSFRVLNLEKERINNVLKRYRFGDGRFVESVLRSASRRALESQELQPFPNLFSFQLMSSI